VCPTAGAHLKLLLFIVRKVIHVCHSLLLFSFICSCLSRILLGCLLFSLPSNELLNVLLPFYVLIILGLVVWTLSGGRERLLTIRVLFINRVVRQVGENVLQVFSVVCLGRESHQALVIDIDTQRVNRCQGNVNP
jgi:hypothetical protein